MKPSIAVLRGNLPSVGHDRDALSDYRMADEFADRAADPKQSCSTSSCGEARGDQQADALRDLETLSIPGAATRSRVRTLQMIARQSIPTPAATRGAVGRCGAPRGWSPIPSLPHRARHAAALFRAALPQPER